MFDSSSSHIDFQSSQSKHTNKTHMLTYLPPFKKQRMDYSAAKNPMKQNMGCEYQKTGTVNFSNFSIPPVFLKSTHHQQNSSKNLSSERVQESQHGFTKFQQQKHVKMVHETNTTELLPPVDEHSETAASHNSAYGIRKKRKANDINLCNQQESSSVCSLEASNDPNFGFRKLREETDDLPYFSDNEEETPEKLDREEEKRVKRSYRNAKNHNLSERKRRDKINEKMHTLKELIPNCNKMDKASMLDDAIDYLKTLKLQLQIMSMGRGLCMPFNNVMMLPAHHMNMNAQHLMSLRPPQVQFPIPQLSRNGITENNIVQMFGFSNQFPVVPPSMSITNAPYMPPITENNSTIPLPTSFGGNQDQHGRTCG